MPSGSGDKGMWITHDKQQLRFYVRGGSGDIFTELASGSSALSTGTWYHVAATREGTTMQLYLDGASIGSGSPFSDPWPDFTGLVEIGRRNGYSHFAGWMDGIRVYHGTAHGPALPDGVITLGEKYLLRRPVANGNVEYNECARFPSG